MRMKGSVGLRNRTRGTQHPAARPTLRCRPDRDNGIPVERETLPFIPEIPVARFKENDSPCFFPIVPPFCDTAIGAVQPWLPNEKPCY